MSSQSNQQQSPSNSGRERRVAFGKVHVREHKRNLDTLDKLSLSFEIVDEHTHNLGTWDRFRGGSRTELYGADGRHGAPVKMAAKAEKKKQLLREQKNATTIDDWYLLKDRRIASQLNNGVTTSPVVEIDGRFVKTESGSVYRLGKLDASVAKILSVIATEDTPFDEENPLQRIDELFYASSLAKGDSRELALKAVRALEALKESLGPACALQFHGIANLLASMGVGVVAPLLPLRVTDSQSSTLNLSSSSTSTSEKDLTRMNTL